MQGFSEEGREAFGAEGQVWLRARLVAPVLKALWADPRSETKQEVDALGQRVLERVAADADQYLIWLPSPTYRGHEYTNGEWSLHGGALDRVIAAAISAELSPESQPAAEAPIDVEAALLELAQPEFNAQGHHMWCVHEKDAYSLLSEEQRPRFRKAQARLHRLLEYRCKYCSSWRPPGWTRQRCPRCLEALRQRLNGRGGAS